MTNLGSGNSGCLRLADCGVHGSFGLGGGGDSYFDESPNAVIERPSAVTFITQFLKCLPYGCKGCRKGFDRFGYTWSLHEWSPRFSLAIFPVRKMWMLLKYLCFYHKNTHRRVPSGLRI